MLSYFAKPKQGLATADNNRFLRNWYEIDHANFCVSATSMQTALSSGCKWFPTQKVVILDVGMGIMNL